MILAGDIGGTKTNLALFDEAGGAPAKLCAQASYASAKYDSLEAILRDFVGRQGDAKVTRSCLGVAGPVVNDAVTATNLAWVVERASVARALGTQSVHLINDLEATAYGIESLAPEQLHTLSEGVGERTGHRALIAAGTGLGMALLFWDGARFRPTASEGGHADFAPQTEIEIELLRYLRTQIGGHVSVERVVSGMGLVNIYNFLRDEKRAQEPESVAREIDDAEDKAARISAAALAGESELAARALDIFVEAYGAAAGNLALLVKPAGGLYVGGGIAPKILEKIKEGDFMRAFKDKGRMSALAASFPVRVILDEKTALYGAARCAQLDD